MEWTETSVGGELRQKDCSRTQREFRSATMYSLKEAALHKRQEAELGVALMKMMRSSLCVE